MRFSLDRRWATLAVAVLLGASGGSLLGFVTAPGGGAAQGLAPVEQPATSTTRRPRGHFAGVTSTTRPRLPAATAGLRPATTAAATTSTARPTTTAPASTTTRTAPTTTTTTTTIGATTSSSTTVAPSTTSTTQAT